MVAVRKLRDQTNEQQRIDDVAKGKATIEGGRGKEILVWVHDYHVSPR
jgi:hypothetical protein